MRFTKMHALGNDFILIDNRASVYKNPVDNSRKIGHRRFGIGADQILLLENSEKADYGMRIFNSDGSEVEMCGNGIRCLAKYIWDRGLSNKETLDIETLAGIIRPKKEGDLIRVDMGEPVLEGRKIPVRMDGMVIDYPLKIEDRTFMMTCVSMGNPHAVIYMDKVDDFAVEHYGPLIENHEIFPKRTNVEFIELISRHEIKMRVWERGAGETMACGTGACAAAVASMLKELTDRKLTVHLLGGGLIIEWSDDNRVHMTGPAVEVFEGEINL